MTKKTKTKRPTKVRHRDATGKSSATVQIGGRAARLTSQHKLELARRRARVAELASEGKSVRDCEQLLRSEGFKHCDHSIVAKDLKLERDRLTQATQATTAQHRARVIEKLTQLENFVRARGWDDPNYVSDLLGIIDRVIRLMGLAEERHHVDIAVNNDTIPPDKLVGWRRWLRETQFVPESSFDAIWAVCRKAIATADGRDDSNDRATGRQPSLARR